MQPIRHTQERKPLSSYGLVVIAVPGAGSRAVSRLMGLLPPWFPVPILIVRTGAPDGDLNVASLIADSSGIPIRQAQEGEVLKSPVALVAAAGTGLTVRPPGVLGPAPNGDRGPEVLLGSAAATFGPGVVLVILTGAGSDWERQAAVVKRSGGVVIAEESEGKTTAGIPLSAIRAGEADYVLPLEEIAPILTHLVVT